MSKYVSVFRFVSLGIFFLFLSGCTEQHEILSGLSENDANHVVVVLMSQDISAKKEAKPGRKVTFSIKVSGQEAQKALKLLVDNKIPKIQSQGLAQIYPQGSGGLIPSATQEKAQLMMAMQGEIENMLLVLPGIVQARVVVVLPETNVMRDLDAAKKQSTASVAVVYNPIDDKGNPSVTSDDIRYLIASAIPELDPSAVTVVMASNHPMKLINAEEDQAKSIVTASGQASGPGGPLPNDVPTNIGASHEATSTETSPIVSHNDPTESLLLEKLEKQNFLVFLFGGIGILGLLFGLISLSRAIMLKRKLNTANTLALNDSTEDFAIE